MAAKPKKFEDELKELEATVSRIDSGELSLEESIEAFERGVALVRSLNQRLDEAEKKVELLMRNAQGELATSPFKDIPRVVESGEGDDDEEGSF